MEVGLDVRKSNVLALLTVMAVAPLAAQPINPFAPVAAATTTANSTIQLGNPLSVTGGPWVLAETLFFSNGKIVSDYAWRDKLRGQRDQLYSANDLQTDLQTLMTLNVFSRVTPAVYAIPSQPIPSQFANIAVSTNEVRVVFDVDMKASTEPIKPKLVTPPSAVSGLILTPTTTTPNPRRPSPDRTAGPEPHPYGQTPAAQSSESSAHSDGSHQDSEADHAP
jgi:hypothetical protein